MTWVYQGDGVWARPVADFATCEHPREYLRFDPRYSAPIACYCRACGRAYIHPHHGLSPRQIKRIRRKARRMAKALGM